MSELSERERSLEEDDILTRSTKKYKDHHHTPLGATETPSSPPLGSYRDRLVGAIPGAYEQAFGFDSPMQEDVESDEEVETPGAGCVAIGLTREEKLRIRAPWASSLIVKTFGRNVGFMYISTKTRSLWNPVGRMDCIDIGHDYFLIKFELQTDLDNVLKGGPWFVGPHFLAIRQWEPDFRPSSATFSSVAVWVRFPELPLEYYEPSILKKMGNAIGPVLRFDSHIVNGVRGRYARLCIQVNLDKPLPQSILIGQGRVQAIQYEGINQLCFSCGRIGHRKENCPFVIRAPSPPKTANDENPESTTAQTHTDTTPTETTQASSEELFGQWMMVTRRKKPATPKHVTSASQVGEAISPIAGSLNNASSFTGQREGKRKSYGFSEKVPPITTQTTSTRRNKDKGKGKSVILKTTPHPKSTPTFLSDSQLLSNQTHTPTRELSSPTPPIFSFGHGSTSGQMGDLSPKQDHPSGQRDHHRDTSRSHLGLGLVRSRDDEGLAKHFPTHGEEQDLRVSRSLRSGVDAHSKSVVVLPHGSTSSSTPRSNDFKLLCSNVAAVPLRTLTDRARGGTSVQRNCSTENLADNPDGMCCDKQHLSGEADAILHANPSLHSSDQKLNGATGTSETCNDSIPEYLEAERGVDPSMEIEGSGR
jgi:hypothetical protein